MQNKIKRTHTLYFEMVKLLLICGLISACFFTIVYQSSSYILGSYVKRSAYTQKKSSAYAAEVQNFVDEHQVSLSDVWTISEWTTDNPIVLMQIFDQDQLIFDSLIESNLALRRQKQRINNRIRNYDYSLRMTDATVRMSIYGSFDYALYNSTMLVELVISFLLFFVLFLLGIRSKMRYIETLRQEVELLESGNLDYPITISGSDELADLAVGLDNMRTAFAKHIEEIESLSATNQQMVTQISHDLRTPLTAISLYADILETGGDLNEEQRMVYLEKILRKVRHMKELSDQLLTYYSGRQAPELPSTVPVQARQVFYDELSDLCSYLEEQGFSLQTDLTWPECIIRANDDLISRIMDNVSSNIRKYAEPSVPVRICTGSYDHGFFLSFENEIRTVPQDVSGSGIGLNNIRTLMKQMQGECLISKNKNHFSVILNFTRF